MPTLKLPQVFDIQLIPEDTGRFLAIHEHRNLAVGKNFLGFAAEQQPLNALAAMGSHEDEITAISFGCVDDSAVRMLIGAGFNMALDTRKFRPVAHFVERPGGAKSRLGRVVLTSHFEHFGAMGDRGEILCRVVAGDPGSNLAGQLDPVFDGLEGTLRSVGR